MDLFGGQRPVPEPRIELFRGQAHPLLESVSRGTHAYIILTSNVPAAAEQGGEASEEPDGSGTESAG